MPIHPCSYQNQIKPSKPQIQTMAPSSSISSESRTCSSLSDDILIEIFAYLPLNSIYKFRCLSKVWLSNLSNPNFITKWFQINKNSLPWIQYHYYHSITYRDSDDDRSRFRNAYPVSHSEFMCRNEHLFSFKFLINEEPFHGARVYLLGSSNGLVLCESFGEYHVCNPLTKTWVSLPSPPSGGRLFDVTGIFCEYSLSFACCYKVVRIPTFDEPSKKFNVDIFSSDLGAWESFEVSCDEKVVGRWSNVVIRNGVLYWSEGLDRMLVYNLNQKNKRDGHRCSLTHLPVEELGNGGYYHSILGESEGSVCCARTRWTRGKRTVSVWVLDELKWQILHKDISILDRMLVYNLNQKNKRDGHRCSLTHLPVEELGNGGYYHSILGESEGSVCCARTRWTRGKRTVSVWVLDELKWQILHKDISIQDIILAEARSLTGDTAKMVEVLGFSPVDRNVVFLGRKNGVCVFNIQTRSIDELCLSNKHGDDDGNIFLPFVLTPMPAVLPTPSWIDT